MMLRFTQEQFFCQKQEQKVFFAEKTNFSSKTLRLR